MQHATPNHYSFDWQGCGLLLIDHASNRTVWLQGDEANRLDDELQNAPDEGTQNLLIDDYFVL